MSEFVPKEKYEGVWNGENVRFTRVWRGRRFTDEECAALCAGETLEVRDLVSQKTGKTYGVRAKLDKLKGKDTGREYIGIDIVNFLPRGLPEVFLKHQFTEDEKIMLEAGKPVRIDDFVSTKTGNTFGATVTYDSETGKLNLDYNR